MTTQRGSGVLLIALFVGVATGLALGLTLTWVVWPVQYYDTDPVDLRPEHKEDYIVLVGAAYAVDRDLARAEARLDKLEEKDIGSVVVRLAERYLQEGRDVEETRGLAKLADALGVSTSAMLVYIATPTPLSNSEIATASRWFQDHPGWTWRASAAMAIAYPTRL